LLAVVSWEAFCDEPPASDKPHRVPVAVLDVAKVFKQSRDFNDEMNRIKREIEEFEKTIRAKQAEIEKLTPKQDVSAQADGLDALKLAQLNALMQVEIAAKRADFLKVEAQAYFKCYQEIEKLVAAKSRERDIGVVLRFNSDEMNPADRNSVLQGVNRAIVYSAIPDLTDEVIKSLNRD
jgi:hypothetical protein